MEKAQEILESVKNLLTMHRDTTRFVVMSREPNDLTDVTEPCKTALLFTVRHVPAALYKGLGGFATNNVNLLKLESYMDGGTMKASHFHMDIQGHPQQHNMLLALEELDYFAGDVRILGSYPAHDYRA